MKLVSFFICMLFLAGLNSCQPVIEVEEVDSFENVNHPRVLYWFWSPDVLQNERYLADLDSIAKKSPFDLIFITARDGVDFYNYEVMRPIFSRLVEKAHQKNLKIGLQLWDGGDEIPLEHSMRLLGEKEVTLDASGHAICDLIAKHVRQNSINRHSDVKVQKSELFKVWAFKKAEDGVYVPETLSDITSIVQSVSKTPDRLTVTINGGKDLAGYSVYVLAQHYYNWSDMYGGYVSDLFREAFKNYASIPFDGTALDEYTHMRITPPWLMPESESFTERFYSPAMAERFKEKYGNDIETCLLAMRYVPEGEEALRIRNINHYMDLMRGGPLQVERDFYHDSKSVFGPETFIGVHNTFHNALGGDELWQTGGNWWTLPREYGHSDETSILPTQMGIAQCSPRNVLYNMYYHEHPDTIFRKAVCDLAYGIRTHYHAYNDTHGWGVKLESPEFMAGVRPIENAASLLNRFNPALPQMDILLVFGMEALQNWYPDREVRSKYELNTQVRPEEVAMKLWNQGYRVVLASSDVITEGKLKVEKNGTLNLNGHSYTSMVYLYPQYMKDSTLSLLEEYIACKGKMLLMGEFGKDFEGTDIEQRISKLGNLCTDIPAIMQGLELMGVTTSRLPGNACINEDGSYVETFYPALSGNESVSFKVVLDKHEFTGTCKGMIAIQTDGKGRLVKLASVGLSELKKDGKAMLRLSSPSDIYVSLDKQGYNIKVIKGTEVLIKDIE